MVEVPDTLEVVKVTRDMVRWSYDDGKGRVDLGRGPYRQTLEADPFPAYYHDEDLVRLELKRVYDSFPVGYPPAIYLLPWAGLSNGMTYAECYYEQPEVKPARWTPTIVFYGNRIPIHPAVTRYLVAHEYGHVVNDWLKYKRGCEMSDESLTYKEYAERRGLAKAPMYGGGTWHLQPEEIFCNDFRILVSKTEIEFWPHPGIPRPDEVPAIQQFWLEAKEDGVR